MTNAYQVYRQTQTHTAAPGELILMLYRGALRFLTAAIDGIERKDIQAAHTNLVKTQDILTELRSTLDMERGGEISANLARLYEYANRRLIEANIRKDAKPAREVQSLLRELLSAWEVAIRQTSVAVSAN